jgi:hypothetical protein
MRAIQSTRSPLVPDYRSVGVRFPNSVSGASDYSGFSAHLSGFGRADERTRTADLVSLRVINRVLQGFAGGCKTRIPRPVSLLCLALRCSVLRSRWCQSGVGVPVAVSYLTVSGRPQLAVDLSPLLLSLRGCGNRSPPSARHPQAPSPPHGDEEGAPPGPSLISAEGGRQCP